METIRKIEKAFGEDSMNDTQIKLWYKCFKDAQQYVESDSHSATSSTSRTPENVECM